MNSEDYELEALKDEYRQLMTEKELAKKNKDMFKRLYKKWKRENQRLEFKVFKTKDKFDELEKPPTM